MLSNAPGSNCIIKWRFLNTKMQEMALKQRLFIYGFAVIAVPKFAAGQQFGQMVVADVIYTKVNDTPYDFMQ